MFGNSCRKLLKIWNTPPPSPQSRTTEWMGAAVKYKFLYSQAIPTKRESSPIGDSNKDVVEKWLHVGMKYFDEYWIRRRKGRVPWNSPLKLMSGRASLTPVASGVRNNLYTVDEALANTRVPSPDPARPGNSTNTVLGPGQAAHDDRLAHVGSRHVPLLQPLRDCATPVPVPVPEAAIRKNVKIFNRAMEVCSTLVNFIAPTHNASC